ncbi:AAA family ATPase [Alcanivorax sp. 1008]|uniref:AAA family ATPase n=1 Tax=Alcanivorax sp. 1008 TaxID=2816853 RepID=UPI001DF54B53|nr:AAA family ATPase [Alcanivorax sp. 1008]MCC1498077.1 AAA family ATPase [Alcanivorax sp. 1008]
MNKISLTSVKLHKYKSFETEQCFEVDPKSTILVGLNESGKTSAIEAIAKTNYFRDEEAFKFKLSRDYPKKELTSIRKSEENPAAITCYYLIPNELLEEINNELGRNVFSTKLFSVTTYYDGTKTIGGVTASVDKFISYLASEIGFPADGAIASALKSCKTKDVFDEIISGENATDFTEELEEYRDCFVAGSWSNGISKTIWVRFLSPNVPKYLYYDEYYSLPSQFSLEKLKSSSLEEEELKTAQALVELANIDIDQLSNTDDWEEFISELEATEASITETLFKYWTTNKNLEIAFRIQPVESTHPNHGTRIVEHILDIRVKNKRAGVTLPLKNRSKGFNWFFSFLVWFNKIQEDPNSNYVILLDEPGLNLHGSAQHDLLRFIEDLTADYQVIYTTHSPFMIQPGQLHRVRTLVEEKYGSRISESVQEKDPDALFPLQAALGYDIAQNLYISPNNLLVEGVSDLIFLQVLSDYLRSIGKTGLSDSITIVPVGGADRIASFISLLRGSKLKVCCLLDTPKSQKLKHALASLAEQKIIAERNVLLFDIFTKYDASDVEDMFEKSEYLQLFNSSFSEHTDINQGQLESESGLIVDQIAKIIGTSRYNHYRPARALLQSQAQSDYICEETAKRFEALFIQINELIG